MTGLAPYRTGASVVVARAYILAVEAAEGVSELLQRVGALRQWGVRRRHRVGVLVRRVEAEEDAGSRRAAAGRGGRRRAWPAWP